MNYAEIRRDGRLVAFVHMDEKGILRTIQYHKNDILHIHYVVPPLVGRRPAATLRLADSKIINRTLRMNNRLDAYSERVGNTPDGTYHA
jgi:hypothetical protein